MEPAAPRLRILQLVTRRQHRGAEVFAAQLCEGLAARGHAVVLTGLYPPAEPPLALERGRTVDLGGRRRRLPPVGTVLAASRLFRRFRPQLVQANGSDTLKIAVLARLTMGRRAGRPLLVYRNISMASAWLRNPLHAAWNRWLVHRVDHVVSQSARTAADFREVYRVDASRISVVPIGTPVPATVDAESARRRLAVFLQTTDHGPVVLHVGSLSAEKDHDVLLDAFSRIAARFPDARLVLIGEGPRRDAITARAARPDLAGRVHLLGAVPRAMDLMAAADLLVLPSRVEGLPGVILEAAARGLPVVATAVGSVPDAVVDGRTGLLMPPGDAAALAAAMERLLSDPALRRRLGQAGRRRGRHHFDLDDVVVRFEALYLRLTEAYGD